MLEQVSVAMDEVGRHAGGVCSGSLRGPGRDAYRAASRPPRHAGEDTRSTSLVSSMVDRSRSAMAHLGGTIA